MRKVISILLVLVLHETLALPRAATAEAVPKPRLVVAIVADQFRYDYLLRFGHEYREGLKELLQKGAVFTNARYEHFPTFTSVGHAALLTGAYPGSNGIIGNSWYDRRNRKLVRSASDETVKLIGGSGGVGSSPRNLMVSTVGDEMKLISPESRVIGISMKDYSGILATGHMADGVYWFDYRAGDFITSSYYVSELPAWVKEFNSRRPADRYKGKEWMGRRFPEETGQKLNASILNSAFGNELLEEMAEAAIKGEKLGKDSIPDLLVLSFSSNDYVGHAFGPDSAEVRELSLATDRALGKLFRLLDAEVGLSNVTVVFTADHGVAPFPELNQKRRMPGGRSSFAEVRNAILNSLTARYGAGDWIIAAPEESIYLNYDLISSMKLRAEEVAAEAARAARQVPNVFRVYTREQLVSGHEMSDRIGRRVANSYSSSRGADLYVILDPYFLYGSGNSTTHGSPFGYDTHVPLIIMGPGIAQGRFHSNAAINDIAPTLATILGTEIPSGSEGRILSEIFVPAR